MAHGDYDCCAICDEKQNYSTEAKTKQEICTECLINLRNQGLNLLSVEELVGWVKTTDLSTLTSKLEAIGYSKCFYDNEIDNVIKNRMEELGK